ncbi:hypothetical protein NPIL_616931 [Nephila pilipes]|uniref:Uncharacterized protein n=1 Tax=Nephila pilipes TaxID=299642 RepID=A0A8X6MA75_NEPPI|nr:hypothetical protein NPIL_616931 [Nephila pilipes]
MDRSEVISAFHLLIKAGSVTTRVILCLALNCFNTRDEHASAKVIFFYQKADADTFFAFLLDFRHRLLALHPSPLSVGNAPDELFLH